jgi:histidinol dehydrogenase
MITKDLLEMATELRNILGSIQGVKAVQEGLTLSYCVVVGEDSEKPDAEAVAEKLSAQAEHYGISLDIVVATEADLKEAADKLKEYQTETQGSFTL